MRELEFHPPPSPLAVDVEGGLQHGGQNSSREGPYNPREQGESWGCEGHPRDSDPHRRSRSDIKCWYQLLTQPHNIPLLLFCVTKVDYVI